MLRDEKSIRVEHEIFMRSFFAVRPPPEVAKRLSAKVRDYFAPGGTVIYEEGAPTDYVYFIIEGEIRLETEGAEPWMFQEQDVIGILDAIIDRPRARTAVATKEVHALAMHAKDFFDCLEDSFEYEIQALTTNTKSMHELALGLAPDGVFEPSPGVDRIGISGGKLTIMERLLALRASVTFERAPVQALVSLAELAKEKRWNAGELIFHEGDPSDQLDVVASGRVLVARKEPLVRAQFGPSELIGGVAEMGNDDHQYTSRAETDCVTLRFEKEDLLDVMEDHNGLGRALFAWLAADRERVMRALADRRKEASDG